MTPETVKLIRDVGIIKEQINGTREDVAELKRQLCGDDGDGGKLGRIDQRVRVLEERNTFARGKLAGMGVALLGLWELAKWLVPMLAKALTK